MKGEQGGNCLFFFQVVALALVQSYRLYAYDLVLPATNATRIDRGSSVTFGDQDDRLEIEAPLFRNFLEQYVRRNSFTHVAYKLFLGTPNLEHHYVSN